MTNSSIDLTLTGSDFGVEGLSEGNALGYVFSSASTPCPAGVISAPCPASAASTSYPACVANASTTFY